MKTKVAIALSGGVDSAVAAALLCDRGYDVFGVTMLIWDGGDSSPEGQRHACYGPGEPEDVTDARRVCEQLGIPFYEFDLRQEYKSEVLDYYTSEYLCGRTPNPCYRCNSRVKFGALFSRIKESGPEFDYFATGHYARVEKDGGRAILKKALDTGKDQSYFVSSLTQDQLSHVMFPLGEYTKQEVRKMATNYCLDVSEKAESQDFMAGGYLSMIKEGQPGPLLDRAGAQLGEHRGIQHYTIGQRKGLGIATAEPLFVTEIDSERNAVIVGGKKEVYRQCLIASGLNWISIEPPAGPLEVKAKIRHAHTEAEAVASPLNDNNVSVVFDKPQLAITPGQAVVFYQEDTVLGSGTIEKSLE